ncbi:NAD(P)H dehydrogenase (quinone), partial [Phenoliferia sp. Uapishka_3]
MANTKLAIFPASGGLGGATLEHLFRSEKANPKDVVLVARSPERLETYRKLGVDIRKADFDQAESLKHAFDGVKVLNLISYASIQHEHRFNVHKLAIDAAIASGVEHVVYSSLAFAGPPSSTTTVAQVMKAHIQTELYLASLHAANPTKFTYTILRQGIYSESFPIYLAFFSLSSPPPDNRIKIPHDGSVPGIAWAKRDELGEATAKLLLLAFNNHDSFTPFRNTTSTLSGPKVYTLNETVEILGRQIGRDVKIEEVTVEEYASQPKVQEGLSYGSGQWATLWATAFEGIRKGETGNVTRTLETILGRTPESFEKTVEDLARQGEK